MARFRSITIRQYTCHQDDRTCTCFVSVEDDGQVQKDHNTSSHLPPRRQNVHVYCVRRGWWPGSEASQYVITPATKMTERARKYYEIKQGDKQLTNDVIQDKFITTVRCNIQKDETCLVGNICKQCTIERERVHSREQCGGRADWLDRFPNQSPEYWYSPLSVPFRYWPGRSSLLR
ncbi:hypothetical protein J6590_008085 [Homalodisca vitripennis]|nr:hypothetical protein J6590_008085 [Homalodisca vitripennis]